MVSLHRRDNPRRLRPLISEGHLIANHSNTKWFKSGHSGAHSNGAEVTFLPNTLVDVRDSKNPSGLRGRRPQCRPIRHIDSNRPGVTHGPPCGATQSAIHHRTPPPPDPNRPSRPDRTTKVESWADQQVPRPPISQHT
ncbi:DUF397 domain-containing protein [Nocardia vinacea]|uniref:DUF397 domain-containing protein n=1 Tax=Nocardia vinacea TaxID=96468 RepID=UPI000A02883B